MGTQEYQFKLVPPPNPFQLVDKINGIAEYFETKQENVLVDKLTPQKPITIEIVGLISNTFAGPEGIRRFADELQRMFLEEDDIPVERCGQVSTAIH